MSSAKCVGHVGLCALVPYTAVPAAWKATAARASFGLINPKSRNPAARIVPASWKRRDTRDCFIRAKYKRGAAFSPGQLLRKRPPAAECWSRTGLLHLAVPILAAVCARVGGAA